MKRASGILLPVFSLPGKYGIGSFSKEAYDFIDFLEKAGQKYWQILPLGPTSYGDSPYQSFSTFAGNPYFISLDALIEKGLLTKEECEEVNFGRNDESIDYEKQYQERFKLLYRAFHNSAVEEEPAFHQFISENRYWIEDYALYMAVKNHFHDVSYDQWDEDIRTRKAAAMRCYREMLKDRILFYEFLQYEFATQWNKLKSYANQKKIRIIGDIPIYVSPDGADIWAHPELFALDRSGRPTAVAGCPPDGFAATGQLWGNPVYNWKYHKRTGYDWWIRRMEKCCELYDVIRIDHFRGFDQFYSIPAGAKDAVNGKWVDGPGYDLFKKLQPHLKDRQIIAEDLGFITDSVRKLVKDTGYPNMKIVEFAFDPRDTGSSNDYLPHNYNKNCVVYTGTHDNETLRGWLKNLSWEERKCVADYVNADPGNAKEITDQLIRTVIASTADYCIIPMQDYLQLDNSARINIPSTLGGNWTWRMKAEDMSDGLAKKICRLTGLYGRK